ncbi:MAG: T9SS type A sorting domain-containing protein [Candidatus Hatepunaea meridiana]|nr:T9SS type A sorting domain-containing protein [Candidatus Hatepunaea meridiana]
MRLVHENLISFLIAILITSSLSAQQSHNIELIDEAMVFGQYNDVAVSGDYAFCATGYGVRVISLRNPANPRILYDYPTPGQAYDILIVGDYAYIADGMQGLAVFSIEDPENIEILRSITFEEGQYFTYIVFDNNRLYVYDKVGQTILSEQLRAFSLDDPSNPRQIRALRSANDAIWTVSNNIKYHMTNRWLSMRSYEDLENIEELATLDLGFGRAESMLIGRGNYMYIVRGESQAETYFYVISMVDRENPEIVATLETDMSYSNAPRMALYGNYAYLSTRFRDGNEVEHETKIINIEDPENPEPVGGFDENLKLYSDFFDHYLIDCKPGSNSEGQFRVVSLENPENPELISRLESPSARHEIRELVTYSDNVYAISHRLYNFSLNNLRRIRENPWPRANDYEPQYPVIYDEHLYMGGRYLYVYNLRDPDSPEGIRYYEHEYPYPEFVIEDDLLLRTHIDNDIDGYILSVYDVSEPDSIVRIGQTQVENTSDLKCVEINDRYVYALGEDRTNNRRNSIYTFSIADPENPELISLQNAGSTVTELRISDRLLFMPYITYRDEPPWGQIESCGIRAFWLLEPDRFQEVGSIDLGRFRIPSIKFVQDRVLFLSCGEEGFKIVSFEEPDNPELLGWSSTHYSVGDIAIEGEIAIVADRYSVGIYDISQAITASFLDISEESHDFESVMIGDTATFEMTITNISDRSRLITEVTFDSEVFNSNFQDQVLLDTNEETVLDVLFHPTELLAYECTMTIMAEGLPLQIPLSGVGVRNDVDIREINAPEKFELFPAYPNPFNSNTSIHYNLPYDSHVTLTIYDTEGRMVKALKKENLKAGSNAFQVDASNWTSGIYIGQLNAGDEVGFTKLVVLF